MSYIALPFLQSASECGEFYLCKWERMWIMEITYSSFSWQYFLENFEKEIVSLLDVHGKCLYGNVKKSQFVFIFILNRQFQ